MNRQTEHTEQNRTELKPGYSVLAERLTEQNTVVFPKGKTPEREFCSVHPSASAPQPNKINSVRFGP